MDRKKYAIREVLFWSDEIFKPKDLIILQNTCEDIYRCRITRINKGTEIEEGHYSGKPHIVLDTSDTYKSTVIPILLEDVVTMEIAEEPDEPGADPGTPPADKEPAAPAPTDPTPSNPDGTTTTPGTSPETSGATETA